MSDKYKNFDNGWMFLSPKCHMGYPMIVARKGKVLRVVCVECGELVTDIPVKEETHSCGDCVASSPKVEDSNVN